MERGWTGKSQDKTKLPPSAVGWMVEASEKMQVRILDTCDSSVNVQLGSQSQWANNLFQDIIMHHLAVCGGC